MIMKWFVMNIVLNLMIVVRIDASFYFKVTDPSINLSGRSSFINWKKDKSLSLGDLGLLNLKNEQNNTNTPVRQLTTNEPITDKNGHQTTDKTLLEWIQSVVGTTTAAPILASPEECSQCKCGMPNNPNRIVGGQDAQVLRYPWMTYLTYKGKFYCAATIISDRYLLTAAHCVDRFDKSQIRVKVGVHKRNSTSGSQTEYRVQTMMKHSGYSLQNYNNDIALIKIKGIIKFEGSMRPVCLPEKGSSFAGKNGIVTGWGAIEESGSLSNTLQEVVVPILSNAECRATKYPSKKITDNMICAGFIEGGKDSCQGDSGGPLHVLDNQIYKVVGIVSWGEGCAVPGYPGVYSRVNRYITWIERNTRDSCFC
ncbi:trypsin-1-like [Chelonus insularis]|uniref:trypsin-1-like n=1 Tax=Chelonus insularis TaxID=460826 RepID=UPI00158AB122|nr:trypsin-1-like [Chelonus insularis]